MGLSSLRNGVPVSGKSAGRVVERLADGVAPALGVAAVVDLVEDDQGLALLGAHPVQGGWLATWA